jgi:RNA polymerase sigma-70 factor (ECF subfamily)
MQLPAPVPPPNLTRAIAAHRSELLRGARQLVGPADAEDLVQSTIERALGRLATFRPDTNLLAWLRRIMGNLSVDTWRQQARQPRCSLDDSFPVAAAAPEPPAIWEAFTAADARAAAATLPDKLRDVFELFANHNLSYAEISRRLRVPVATIGTRLMRARLAVRKRLEAGVRAPIEAIGKTSERGSLTVIAGLPSTNRQGPRRWAGRATAAKRPQRRGLAQVTPRSQSMG